MAALMLGPRGELRPLPVSALVGSPFDSYIVPGLILFALSSGQRGLTPPAA